MNALKRFALSALAATTLNFSPVYAGQSVSPAQLAPTDTTTPTSQLETTNSPTSTSQPSDQTHVTSSIPWDKLEQIIKAPESRGSIHDLFEQGFGLDKAARFEYIKKQLDEKEYTGTEQQNIEFFNGYAQAIKAKNTDVIAPLFESGNTATSGSSKKRSHANHRRTDAKYNAHPHASREVAAPGTAPSQAVSSAQSASQQALRTSQGQTISVKPQTPSSSNDSKQSRVTSTPPPTSPSYQQPASAQPPINAFDIGGLETAARRFHESSTRSSSESHSRVHAQTGSSEHRSYDDSRTERNLFYRGSGGYYGTHGAWRSRGDGSTIDNRFDDEERSNNSSRKRSRLATGFERAMDSANVIKEMLGYYINQTRTLNYSEAETLIRGWCRIATRAYSHQRRGISNDVNSAMDGAFQEYILSTNYKDLSRQGQYQRFASVLNHAFVEAPRLQRRYEQMFEEHWTPLDTGMSSDAQMQDNIYKTFKMVWAAQQVTRGDHEHDRNSRYSRSFLLGFILGL
ncbi:hypothetical protein HY641_02365 [Candidatus Woesearchaeota archaeon]|nr:hypothetical protein [Candidatus Woesearchaeota archaeon]